MPDLVFSVEGVEPVPYSATPLLGLKLRVRNGNPEQAIQNIILQAQVRIETMARRYQDQEQARLLDLFGEPARWSQTLRAMLWTHSSVTVRPFSGETSVELPLPCTFDFNVAATKYFDALAEGEVPLRLLFSGTVFYMDSENALRVEQIPWDREAVFRLPVAVWKRAVDEHYPNSAWLNLRRDVFDRLHDYKRRHGIATWDQAVEQLLS